MHEGWTGKEAAEHLGIHPNRVWPALGDHLAKVLKLADADLLKTLKDAVVVLEQLRIQAKLEASGFTVDSEGKTAKPAEARQVRRAAVAKER